MLRESAKQRTATLRAEHQDEILQRDARITGLQAELERKRDPAKAYHHGIAKDVLAGLSDDAKKVLRHLWTRDKIVQRYQVAGREYDDTFQMAGISGSDLRGILEKLVALELVHYACTRDHVGVLHSWEITPGFKGVLGELLFTEPV